MLTLFTTPKAFRGHINVIQRNALRSWKLLDPDAEVIVFGGDEGAADVCHELGLRHEAEVARSASGTKRVDSIFGRAQEIARHSTLCYVNCDIILTKDFVEAVRRVRVWRENFLMVGCRWDTDVTTPIDFARSDWGAELVRLARTEGYRRFYYNIDYFVFRRGMYAEIPQLVIGRVGWDHWLVGRAHADRVPIVDATDTVCAVHQNHDYGYHPKGMTGVWYDAEAKRNLELTRRSVRPRTIEDAEFRLTASGIERNRMHRLAPTKRAVREGIRLGRAWMQTYVWHPLLNATRPVRHALGLRKETIPEGLQRSKRRRHWLDAG